MNCRIHKTSVSTQHKGMLGCGIDNQYPDLNRNTFFPLNSWHTYRADEAKSLYSVGPEQAVPLTSYCNNYEGFEVT